MKIAGVDRVILVPPSWDGYRNDYALEAAQKYPDRFAVMGKVPLNDPASKIESRRGSSSPACSASASAFAIAARTRFSTTAGRIGFGPTASVTIFRS